MSSVPICEFCEKKYNCFPDLTRHQTFSCLKNPNLLAEDRLKYLEKERARPRNQKTQCECGRIITKSHIETHRKSQLHKELMNALNHTP